MASALKVGLAPFDQTRSRRLLGSFGWFVCLLVPLSVCVASGLDVGWNPLLVRFPSVFLSIGCFLQDLFLSLHPWIGEDTLLLLIGSLASLHFTSLHFSLFHSVSLVRVLQIFLVWCDNLHPFDESFGVLCSCWVDARVMMPARSTMSPRKRQHTTMQTSDSFAFSSILPSLRFSVWTSCGLLNPCFVLVLCCCWVRFVSFCVVLWCCGVVSIAFGCLPVCACV